MDKKNIILLLAMLLAIVTLSTSQVPYEVYDSDGKLISPSEDSDLTLDPDVVAQLKEGPFFIDPSDEDDEPPLLSEPIDSDGSSEEKS